jgi:hypothetical protein
MLRSDRVLISVEMNIAENAEAYRNGNHDGWEPTAWEGLSTSLNALAERKTKAVINGGALNPAGLATKVHELVSHFIKNEACVSLILLGTRTGAQLESCLCLRR